MDERDSLIAEQQLFIRRCQEDIENMQKALDSISKLLHSIGGPLNDNKHSFTVEQMKIFYQITKIISEAYN